MSGETVCRLGNFVEFDDTYVGGKNPDASVINVLPEKSLRRLPLKAGGKMLLLWRWKLF